MQWTKSLEWYYYPVLLRFLLFLFLKALRHSMGWSSFLFLSVTNAVERQNKNYVSKWFYKCLYRSQIPGGLVICFNIFISIYTLKYPLPEQPPVYSAKTPLAPVDSSSSQPPTPESQNSPHSTQRGNKTAQMHCPMASHR